MHFHLPKPLHGWREFVGEVGIITFGILLALGAEQMVDAAHWREKVASATTSIEFEINDQLDYSEEILRFAPCAGPYIDALEAAILSHDKAAIARLTARPPFEPRPWRSTTWQSAMSTQVADHLQQDDLDRYAFMFSSFDDLDRTQEAIITDFADATVGRLGAPADAASTQSQLAAAERLRTRLKLAALIAETMVDTAAGKTRSNWKAIERHRWQRLPAGQIQPEGAQCQALVKAVAGGARRG